MKKSFVSLCLGLCVLMAGTVQAQEENTYKISEVKDVNGILFDKSGNKVTGVVVSNYENGMLAEELTYVNGVKNGVQILYSHAGRKFARSNFKNNKEQGETRLFYSAGGTLAVLQFDEGNLIEGYCVKEFGEKVVLTDKDKDTFMREGTLPCEYM